MEFDGMNQAAYPPRPQASRSSSVFSPGWLCFSPYLANPSLSLPWREAGVRLQVRTESPRTGMRRDAGILTSHPCTLQEDPGGGGRALPGWEDWPAAPWDGQWGVRGWRLTWTQPGRARALGEPLCRGREA